MKTKNRDFKESSSTKSDADSVEDLQPYLVDFREFSHIAYELEQPKYADWFDGVVEHGKRVKHAHQLSRQALQFLQWENGSQENERVRVAVIGDFSSGKSSFINSLLGQNICPVNVAASTSSITTFKYGDDEAIYLVGNSDKINQSQRRPLSRSEYEKMVTHQGQKGTNTDIRHEFEIYYPFDGFRDIELYDTPGFNNPENSQDKVITEEKFKNADVIFFVFDIEKGNISADILNSVLMPMRRDKPDQPMIAIANRADRKPPAAVKRICDEIHSVNLFNQVMAYSALEEMNVWKKMVIPASPESILESLKQASPCKIEADDNGFVLTPLSPKSARREPILQWMKTIRGQKETLIKAKRQSELNEYFKQGKVLLKELQRNGQHGNRENSENTLSSREQVLKAVTPSEVDDALRGALSSAIESALSFNEITGGPDKGFFTPNYRVSWNNFIFESRLNGVGSKFTPVIAILTKFVSAVPIECSSYVEQPCRELLKLIKNPVALFKPLDVELCGDDWSISRMVCGEKSEAVTFCERIQTFGIDRGVEIFYEQAGAQANLILDQLDIYDAKHAGSAEARTEHVKMFNTRIQKFSDIFLSRTKPSLVESVPQ